MSQVEITLWSICEMADGSKSINYSVKLPNGHRRIGCRVPLGGTISVDVKYRDPDVSVVDRAPEPRTEEERNETR